MEEYQQYVATLTPSSGKLIDLVRVTMGGTDITNQVFSGTAATMLFYVTQNLTNCVSSYSRDVAEAGATFTATLTADTGYAIKTITITMEGEDMSQYYSGGTINIPSVTGNIIITATAQQTARENLLTMNDGNINKRMSSAGLSNANGYFTTDYFAFDYATNTGIRIVDVYSQISELLANNRYSECKIEINDASKTRINNSYISQRRVSGETKFDTDNNDLVVTDLATNYSSGVTVDWTTVKFIRLTLALNNASAAISSVDDVLNSGIKIYVE